MLACCPTTLPRSWFTPPVWCPWASGYYTHRIGRTGRARRQGVSYLMYTPDEEKRVAELLRLTRNQATPVHFDFNHEKLVEEKVEQGDRFNIRAYF